MLDLLHGIILISISLMKTSEVEHLLICSPVFFFWPFFVNCLFSYFDPLKKLECMPFSYWCIEVLNIFCVKLLSQVYFGQTSALWLAFFTLFSGFFDKQKFFISCGPIYQFFSLLLMLLIPCLRNDYGQGHKDIIYIYYL